MPSSSKIYFLRLETFQRSLLSEKGWMFVGAFCGKGDPFDIASFVIFQSKGGTRRELMNRDGTSELAMFLRSFAVLFYQEFHG